MRSEFWYHIRVFFCLTFVMRPKKWYLYIFWPSKEQNLPSFFLWLNFVHSLHEHLRPVFQPLTPVRFSFHLPCLHGKSLKVFISQTHSGSVWKVTWAHPEFGQVLASCSFDRTAAVWEEQGKTNYICYLYYDVIFENYDWNIES